MQRTFSHKRRYRRVDFKRDKRDVVVDVDRDRFISHQECSRLLRFERCAYHGGGVFQVIFGIAD